MKGPEHVIELFTATLQRAPPRRAAGLATLDLYRDEKLFEKRRPRSRRPGYDAVMSLKGLPNVLDIRTMGLVAGIDLASRPDAFGPQRAFEAMDRGFRELDVMVRITGDTIALSRR